MKRKQKVTIEQSIVDLNLDKMNSNRAMSKSILSSIALNPFSEYAKKEQNTLKALSEAITASNPLKETQKAILKAFNKKQYTYPEFPKLETIKMSDYIIKQPLPKFDDKDKHWKEEILNKFDKLLQEQSKEKIPTRHLVGYIPKDSKLIIDGQNIFIKGKNQRELCSQLFKKTSKEENIVTIEKLIKNLDQQDVFSMTSKKRNKLADKYIRDAISLNNTLRLKYNIKDFLIATREYIKVKN